MPIITLDYTPAYEQGGGIGRYVRELVRALALIDDKTDYRLFVSGAQPAQLPAPPADNFAWCPTRLSPRWLARIWHRARLPLPVDVFTGKTQLFHATDFVLPPTKSDTRTILTVHDLSFVQVPETASPSLKAYLDAVVPRSVQRADHILADSQATKDDLVSLYGTPADKISVLLSGVDAHFQPVTDPGVITEIRNNYSIGQGPYVFSVGTVQPRKNYVRLVQALAALRAEGYDLSLVIAGGKGWLDNPIYDAIRDSGMADFVHLIGFVDESDLPGLYSGAVCSAFPSLYEGFGLPILEAMACGTPVMTANVSSLPEVAGDAALMVDPYDTEAIASAIQRLVDDEALRTTLIQAGYERAGQFTWEAAARHLKQVYEQVLA